MPEDYPFERAILAGGWLIRLNRVWGRYRRENGKLSSAKPPIVRHSGASRNPSSRAKTGAIAVEHSGPTMDSGFRRNDQNEVSAKRRNVALNSFHCHRNYWQRKGLGPLSGWDAKTEILPKLLRAHPGQTTGVLRNIEAGATNPAIEILNQRNCLFKNVQLISVLERFHRAAQFAPRLLKGMRDVFVTHVPH